MAISSSFLLRPIRVGMVRGSKAKESSPISALHGLSRMHRGGRTLNLTVPLKSCAINDMRDNRHAIKSSIEGLNPSLSAIVFPFSAVSLFKSGKIAVFSSIHAGFSGVGSHLFLPYVIASHSAYAPKTLLFAISFTTVQ